MYVGSSTCPPCSATRPRRQIFGWPRLRDQERLVGIARERGIREADAKRRGPVRLMPWSTRASCSGAMKTNLRALYMLLHKGRSTDIGGTHNR